MGDGEQIVVMSFTSMWDGIVVIGRSRVERMVVILNDERTVLFILHLFEAKWGEGETGSGRG